MPQFFKILLLSWPLVMAAFSLFSKLLVMMQIPLRRQPLDYKRRFFLMNLRSRHRAHNFIPARCVVQTDSFENDFYRTALFRVKTGHLVAENIQHQSGLLTESERNEQTTIAL